LLISDVVAKIVLKGTEKTTVSCVGKCIKAHRNDVANIGKLRYKAKETTTKYRKPKETLSNIMGKASNRSQKVT